MAIFRDKTQDLIEQFERDNPPVLLADPPKKTSSRREIGFTGTRNYSGTITDEEYNVDLKDTKAIPAYRKMRMSDAQINATCMVYELPIRAASWVIEPGSNDNVDMEIAEFVENQLFNNLNFTFDSFLKNALKYLQFGFYVFEKVLKITDDNKVGLKKLAVRKPETIEKWMIDKETGDLDYVEQFAATPAGSFKRVNIENSKLLIFVNDQEGGNYKGISFLRSVYPNWKCKQLLLKIDTIRHDRQGLGIPVADLPVDAQEGDEAKLRDMLENLRAHQKQYIIKQKDQVIEWMDMKASSTTNPLESIKYHNQEMSNNILAQFMELGQAGTGTYALGKELRDMFNLSLLSITNYIAGVLNGGIEGRTLIRELVDLNWPNVKNYPKIKANKIHQVDYVKLSSALNSLASQNLIQPDFDLENFVRDALGAPELKETEEQYQKKVEDKKALQKKIAINADPDKDADPDKEIDKDVEEDKKGDEGKEGKEVKAHDHSHSVEFVEREPGQYWRPLTDKEVQINLVEIDVSIRNFRDLLVMTGDKYKNEMIKFLVDKGTRLLSSKKDFTTFQTEIDNVRLPLIGKLEQEFYRILKDLYKYSAEKVRQELNVQGVKFADPITNDPEEAWKAVKVLSQIAVKKMADKLANEWKGELIRQRLVGQVASNNLRSVLVDLSQNVFKNEMQETANQTFGIGRASEAMKVKDQIEKVLRSEVMDDNTCSECAKIDGGEYDPNDPAVQDFIGGGYIDCEGGPERCRGINIFVKSEDK